MSDFLVKILQERGISRYRLSKMTGITTIHYCGMG